ncbi:hypothetical protein [Citricoccus nitrophenolicus]|uniref:hypothetical protein n=1 Tax=Citricoccus nitrophenolicus TaxID=863575 RepID=UPI0031EF129F
MSHQTEHEWHASLLLACSAVGCLAGVLAPTFWLDWSGLPWAGVVAASLLLVPLAGSVSVALLALTWLSVPPSALVGMWLLGAGLFSWPGQRSRRAVMRSGAIVMLIGLGQMLVWWISPGAPAAGAVLLNVMMVGFLTWQAVRNLPVPKRTTITG